MQKIILPLFQFPIKPSRLIASAFFSFFLSSVQALLVNAEPHHAIAMHGSPKYPPNFQHFDYASPNAKKGGELKLGLQGHFDSLNPFIAKGSSADHLSLIYDTLTVSAADEAFSRYGLLAESMEYPEDRTWIIFNLRPEAKFNDGQPVTAEDVVFSFNTLMKHGSPIFQSYYAEVDSVTALSTQRVKFQFKPGVNRELALIVGEISVLPKHFWEGRDFSQASLEPPLGSGPYRIANFDTGRQISYQRVENYWAKDLAVNTGLYNFNTITIDYYKDSSVLLEALKAEQYDFRLENSSKQWATGYNGNALKQAQLVKEEIAHQLPTGMQAFLMNLRRPLFQDIRVRKALNFAFNFEWSNKNLFYNAYTRSQSYFSNSELASSGPISDEELKILLPFKNKLPESLFNNAYKAPVSEGDKYNRKNLIKAKKLLDEAGWFVKNNQLKNKQGELFTFEILLVQPSFERIVNPMVQSLKKLGITVKVRHVEVSQYINRLRSFDFDMVIGSYGQSLSPGNEQIDYWHSSRADVEASRNLIGIKNPVIDNLVELLLKAPDRESLVYRTRALDRVLLNYHYVIPQWHISSHRIAYWNKFQRPAIAPKYDPQYQTGLMTWWLTESTTETTP